MYISTLSPVLEGHLPSEKQTKQHPLCGFPFRYKEKPNLCELDTVVESPQESY